MRLIVLCLMLLGAGVARSADETLYTVKEGDHPWNIAQRYLLEPGYAERLVRLNRIPDNYSIPPGTRLRIPLAWLKLQEAQARLVALHGDSSVLEPGAAPRPAQQGEVLPPGAVLRTGAQASAQLEFADGSRVLVRQLTEARLLRAQQPMLVGSGSLVELELLRGALENRVQPLSGPRSRFEIRTPAAVAAVRGTQFRVSAGTQQTWTEVLEGGVLVSNPAGQTPTPAGTGSVAELGRPPGTATALLAAPVLSALPARLERLPIDWPVPPVPGAGGYRTQVAPDAKFDVVLSDELTPSPRVRVSDVDDAQYTLRVRAVDARGLEGLVAERVIEVYARPEPPLLIEPAPDAQTLQGQPLFRWTQGRPNWNYRLQLYAGVEPGAALLDEQVVNAAGQATARNELPAGLYRWRIAAIDPAKNNRQGPWGDSQDFRRVLPGPGVEPPQLEGGGVTLRWPLQTHARSYRLQVGLDPAFSALLLDVESSAPQHMLKQPAPGTYYVRVLSVGIDGFASPWGGAQTLIVPPAPEPKSNWEVWLLLLPLLFAI